MNAFLRSETRAIGALTIAPSIALSISLSITLRQLQTAAKISLLLFAIAGCTLQPAERLSSERDWELRGKLGFRAPDESGSALINWQQRGDTYRIHLSGPLGMGAVDINGEVPGRNKKGHVSLREGGKPPRHSDDVALLLQELLGWHLPVDSALHWVRGRPSGSKDSIVTRAPNGDLATITEAGWTVEYLRFSGENSVAPNESEKSDIESGTVSDTASDIGQNSAQRLPSKLRLSRGDLRLTLLIKQWRAPRPLKP